MAVLRFAKLFRAVTFHLPSSTFWPKAEHEKTRQPFGGRVSVGQLLVAE